jgi:hypothetical protein
MGYEYSRIKAHAYIRPYDVKSAPEAWVLGTLRAPR